MPEQREMLLHDSKKSFYFLLISSKWMGCHKFHFMNCKYKTFVILLLHHWYRDLHCNLLVIVSMIKNIGLKYSTPYFKKNVYNMNSVEYHIWL